MKSESIPVVNIIGKGSCVRITSVPETDRREDEEDNDLDEVESGRGLEAAFELDLKKAVDFDFNCPSVRAGRDEEVSCSGGKDWD